ncbi:MAG: HNH endonuclease [Chitinophagaceae bacterium]|nr:HNH endonuclease [Chitinophagaceae bacterium]
MEEIWKTIAGELRKGYQVSNLGNVRSVGKKGKIRNIVNMTQGLKMKVTIWYVKGQKSMPVAQLVAETFIGVSPDPDKCIVGHKDGDFRNNCVDNLQYQTKRVANAKQYANSFNKSSKKFNEIQVFLIKFEYAMQQQNYKQLAKTYKCSTGTLFRLINEKSY